MGGRQRLACIDDAELTKGPKASNEALAATKTGKKIRIVGSLTSGQVVTVKYAVKVKVKAYDKRGDHALGNVVVVTGQPPVCAADTQLCTKHETAEAPPAPPAPSDNGLLPDAGAPATLGMIGVALLVLFGGGELLLAGRRRREDPRHARRCPPIRHRPHDRLD